MARSTLSAFSQSAKKNQKNQSSPDEPLHVDMSKGVTPGPKDKEALRIVKKYMYWSMGIGCLPLPLVNVLGSASFQTVTIKELSNLYGIPFSDHKIVNTIAILHSGLATLFWGDFVARFVARLIPVIGPVINLAATPIAAGAVTYATGKVFIQHFEAGGTILSFNPKVVRDYYEEQYEEGRTIASQMYTTAEETL